MAGDVSTFIEALLVSPMALAIIVVMELNGGPVSTGVIGGWRLLLPLAGVRVLSAALPLLGGDTDYLNVTFRYTHVP